MDRRQFSTLAALTAAMAGFPISAGAAETRLAAGKSRLPALPYGFGDLEPAIDARTMEIHFQKHHAGYVANLVKALEPHPKLAAQPLPQLLALLPEISDEATRTAIRNNGGGHWNHSFFWETLAPAAKSGEPDAKLVAALTSAFGSVDNFKSAFATAAANRFGSGWVWLIARPDGTLAVTSTPNQDNPLMRGIIAEAEIGTPLLGVDVWEHAYYLHYQNRRAEYLAAWWGVVNWSAASRRFATV